MLSTLHCSLSIWHCHLTVIPFDANINTANHEYIKLFSSGFLNCSGVYSIRPCPKYELSDSAKWTGQGASDDGRVTAETYVGCSEQKIN